MKKLFPCGHKGKGKHCHRCAIEKTAPAPEPKKARPISPPKTRDALALLLSEGFEHIRTNGSHATYRHPDGRVIGMVVNHQNDNIDFRALLELRKLGVLKESA